MYSYYRSAAEAPKVQGPANGGNPHRWTNMALPTTANMLRPDPFTRQEAHWLYRDQDGHHAIGITPTQFVGPDTGTIYQIEVHWTGPSEDFHRSQVRPEYWFAARKPSGGWITSLSKKFSTYDSAFDYWGERIRAAQERLDESAPKQLPLDI